LDVSSPDASLQRNWYGRAPDEIRRGKWDYVVLEVYPHPESQSKYIRLFNAEITKSGARTVLLTIWARHENAAAVRESESAFDELAKELNAIVAPVGLVFDETHKLAKIGLTNDIQDHPTTAGAHVMACVVYLVLLNHSPCPRLEPSLSITRE